MAKVMIIFHIICVLLIISGANGTDRKSEGHPSDMCFVTIGPCSVKCYNDCCEQKCKDRSAKTGWCEKIPRSGLSLCQCEYECN
ncbi:hypothetical protein Hanom_Chr04g00382871 [Helianthus anomalus]